MAYIKVEIQPFEVPDRLYEKGVVRPRQAGFFPVESHPLSWATVETLSTLCDEFRAEVFKKAGKVDSDRDIF